MPKRKNAAPKEPKPHGDTADNEAQDGKPPLTWNPGKTTQPQPAEESEE